MRAFRSMFLLWMLAMLAQMACAVAEVGGGERPRLPIVTAPLTWLT